jgi:hypothetical protein
MAYSRATAKSQSNEPNNALMSSRRKAQQAAPLQDTIFS